MDPQLRDLQERYTRLCKLLGHAPAYSYQHQIQTRPLMDGAPHVELAGGSYEYVVTERGRELERRTARDQDELLYWLMSDVTAGVAMRLDAKRLFRTGDARRWWFARNVELLRGLSPEWGDRKQAEYEQVLSKHPYRDPKASGKRGWRFWG